MKKYQVIYADPPWQQKKTGKRSVRPNQGTRLEYPTMSIEEIASLNIENLADEKCHLFLWTIQKFLPQSFDIVKKWGFNYKRALTWDKMNGICLAGFHHRTEFLIHGERGTSESFKYGKAIPTLLQFSSKRLRHSEKPKEIRAIVSNFGENRLELFARQRTEGWDVFGNEVEGSIIL